MFELQTVGGVSRYWSETIARFDSSARDIAYLEGPGVMRNVFRREMTLKKKVIAETGTDTVRRLIGPKESCDVFHSSYYRISHRARANVVTIHDFMNEMFPSRLADRILALQKKRACRHADAITVVSGRTRQDLLRLYPFVDPGRVYVTHNGVDPEFYPEQCLVPFDIGEVSLSPRGYFLYVGTRGYCKNFPYVLKVLAEARQQGLMLPLVIVGGGALSDKELAEAARLRTPRSALIQLSSLPNASLRKLYSNCLTLLIPSTYEGFGLPAVEAARCGALVLAARGSALDEIVGETEYAFDLTLADEPARVLALGLDNARAESERARLQERSTMFDWDASAKKLMEIYDDL